MTFVWQISNIVTVLLYISTTILVPLTLKAGRSLLFQIFSTFLQVFDAKKIKNVAKISATPVIEPFLYIAKIITFLLQDLNLAAQPRKQVH